MCVTLLFLCLDGMWCLCYDIQLTPGGYCVTSSPRQEEVEMDTGFSTGIAV